MKVILLENVRKIGSIGEIIDVKRGFARNYLISKKKALFASKENVKEVEKIKQDLNKKDQEKKRDAKNIEEKIQNKQYEIKKLSTENKELYGSVKPTEISKLIAEKEQVQIFPARELLPTESIKNRAMRLISSAPWGRAHWEKIAAGEIFDGMESWLPWVVDKEETILDCLPKNSRLIFIDPERSKRKVEELQLKHFS